MELGNYRLRRFREFGSTSNQPHNRRPSVCRLVGERFADVNAVNRVPHGGSGVMVWAGISYGQSTIAFYWWHTDTVPRSWGALLIHSSATITSCFSIIMPHVVSINFMRRRCVEPHKANGHKIPTGFWSTPYLFIKTYVTNRCISVFPVMRNP